MDLSADHIVTPSLIEASERLHFQLCNTCGDAGILLVIARALLHDLRTQLDGNGLLNHDVVEVYVVTDFGPSLSHELAFFLIDPKHSTWVENAPAG